jgi:Fe2+ or Zn2+ uptake regulation protein
MQVEKVLAVLDSHMRREIFKVISRKPSTVLEVFEELKKGGLRIKYRETVYRALEKAVAAGLAEKYYDKGKGLCYKMTTSRLVIDLTHGTVSSESLKTARAT